MESHPGLLSTSRLDALHASDGSSLHDRTLVLNRSWMAVNVTTVKRALTLIYLGCARAIEPESFNTYDFESWVAQELSSNHRTIRAVSRRIRAPELIVLQGFDQQPVLRVPFSRKNLFIRDNYCCQYCGRRGNDSELGVDHVVPRSRGGASSWQNCVLACHHCNVKKSNRTPAEASMRLMRQPSQPRWPIHFALGHERRRSAWQTFIGDLASSETA